MTRIKAFLNTSLVKLGEEYTTISDLLSAAIILFFSYLIFRWLRRILNIAKRRGKLVEGQSYALLQLSRYVIIIITGMMILNALHVKITALLAGGAVFLVGIGLGLQQLAKDLISGLILLVENTIRVGDIIEVNGFLAKVEEIGLRTSIVENRENVHLIIPNSKIVQDNIINWSTINPVSRFSVSVGVAYGSDVELVKNILMDCVQTHPKVITNKPPFVRFNEFGDSSLKFEVFFWSLEILFIEDVQSDLRFQINQKFKENNVVIPFPQRDVHLYKKEAH